MENLLSIINTVLENRGKETLKVISENYSLKDDCGLDSLDLAELTVRIEAEYDIDIFEDGIVTTVGEILSKLG
ncbi:phosphopantetheine-binding protein [Parabacteroides distasonis]|jgi:acyl carrier protein|uniref:acyl carrier protein n=1 Tax=Parabacteroides distasonis TaxID=823 RepID=UPI00189AC6C3|nr:phosphopantetheine-binding protein [Parabacteroides distasonis]MDB8998124.1 phosphopantetheine-binding protein [Parabacteroides distasonis]MDB9072771.1 phosphopantetheine-binding protein [Parabacteroides distasonis]